MSNDLPSQEKPIINKSDLRDIAIFLEGIKFGKGNILPLGTIQLESLWNTIRAINFESFEDFKINNN